MCKNIIKTFKLVFFYSSVLFFSAPFLFTVYAEEADEKTRDISVSTAADYRQQLGKIVAVEEEFYHHDLDSYVRYMPSCGADAQSGKVALIESAAEYSYTMKVFDQLPIEFALGTKYIGITNSTAVKLPSVLTSTAFGAETTLPFFNFKKTYFTIGLAPRFNTDNWSISSSAFSLSQRYFFIYQANDKLTFIAGVSITPHENDPLMPILGFIYKPNDRLTFNIIPKQPEISYVLTKKFTLFGQADITMDEYKVTKDDLKNAVLEYNEIHAGAGLRYEVNKYIQSSISLGGIFNRSIKYQNNFGKVKLDNGMYTEFRVEIAI